MRSERDEVEQLNPMAALAAFGRAAYSDLVSIVILSVLASLAVIPLITIGAAIVALVETLTETIAGELAGEGVSERQRALRFVRAVRANLWRGLPLSALIVAVIGSTGVYLLIATAVGSTGFLLGAAVGLYAVFCTIALSLRTASLLVRMPEEQTQSMFATVRDAAYHLLETPSFTVLAIVFMVVLVALSVTLRIAVVILLPGLLALLEVIVFEEMSGVGARRVVRAYRGELQ